MERELKEIITPTDGHKVKIKEWLTGGEKRNITMSMIGNTSFSTKETGEKDFTLNAEMISKAQDIALETVIVSVNDSKENILKTILDMRSNDFDFVINEINKITGNTDDVKKK